MSSVTCWIVFVFLDDILIFSSTPQDHTLCNREWPLCESAEVCVPPKHCLLCESGEVKPNHCPLCVSGEVKPNHCLFLVQHSSLDSLVFGLAHIANPLFLSFSFSFSKSPHSPTKNKMWRHRKSGSPFVSCLIFSPKHLLLRFLTFTPCLSKKGIFNRPFDPFLPNAVSS